MFSSEPSYFIYPWTLVRSSWTAVYWQRTSAEHADSILQHVWCWDTDGGFDATSHMLLETCCSPRGLWKWIDRSPLLTGRGLWRCEKLAEAGVEHGCVSASSARWRLAVGPICSSASTSPPAEAFISHELETLFCVKINNNLININAQWWGSGMVISLERGADLHKAQLMPLPLTVSCFSKIQIVFICLVPAHPGSPGKKAVKCVCVCAHARTRSARVS